MSKRPVKKHLLQILILSLVIILAGGGVALLNQWNQGNTASYASSDYVVGPPSLPASFVDSIFRQMGSPMVGTGQAVEAASRARNIDDAFALAVWWTETNDGAAGVGLADRNPGSVRGSVGYPSAFDGYTIYPSYTAAVNYWFMMMQKVYIQRGLTTVSSISHPYVGTSTSDLWAGKVITLMQRYRAEAPPPPTPAPTIAPDTARQGKQLALEQQQQGNGKSTYYPPTIQTAPTAQTTGSTSHGLSGNMRLGLVLFDMLLALAIGLWAWSVNRRYAKIQPVTAAAEQSLPQTSANMQPPAAFAPPSMPVGAWSQPASLPQMSNPWELQPSATIQGANSLWGQTPAFAQQSSFFNGLHTPQPERTTDELTPDMRTTEILPSAPSAQPGTGYTAATSLFAMETFFSEQPQSPFQEPRTPQPQPDPTFEVQQNWFATAPAQDQEQTTDDYEEATFVANGARSSAPGPFHRTRLRATNDQPQPVGIMTTGGGLLSRYREQRIQSEEDL